jgi:uncharacterized membrane-anchored protein
MTDTDSSRFRNLVIASQRPGHIKVPEITAIFWVTKVLTTAMGESTSDYFVHTWGPGIAVPLAGLALGASLIIQFRAKRYVAWTYWLAVVMVAIFGTMAADVLHKGLGVSYSQSTGFFSIVLAAVFVIWFRWERTLSIHSICTPRREVFYWATVMATFALGTAAGDWTARTLNIGYFGSAVMFSILIVVPGLAYRKLGLNAVAAFWTAYVLTRPLGASFADWFAVPRYRGGLAL